MIYTPERKATLTECEEAARVTIAAYKNGDRNWRTAALRPGLEMGSDFLHGTGLYPLDESGHAVPWDGVWVLEGKALICRNSLLDGT